MKTSRMLMVSLLLARFSLPRTTSSSSSACRRSASVTRRANYADGNFSYQNWNSAQLSGKVQVIQHIAGRSSAKDMNDPLIEAIKKAKLPHDRYQTTTIVNTDDALMGTAMFVRSSIEDSKKEFRGRSLSSAATATCARHGICSRKASYCGAG